MAKQQLVIRNRADCRRFIQFLQGMELTKPLQINWKHWNPKRSLNANALYWVWLDQLAQFFTDKERQLARRKSEYTAVVYDSDDMHDMMRHQFLGYENRRIRNTEIKEQLRSTTKLNSTEFCDYMTKMDSWAVSHGCFLTRPEDSEYARYLEQTA